MTTENYDIDPDRDMGANCPECGVRITIDNAGGYRTYCEDCVDELFENSK